MSLYTRGRTRRSLIDTVAFRALSQIAGILSFVLMVRAMSKQDFGAFNLLYAFIPVISTFASLGLEQTLRRYQPEYLQAGNLAAANWLVRIVASARFGTNVVLLSLVLLGWNFVAPLFKLDLYKVEFSLFCLLVLVFFQSRILQMSLAAHMLHRFSVGSMAVLGLVKLGAYGVLLWLGTLNVRNAVIADTVAFGIAYLFLLYGYRKYCVDKAPVSGFKLDPLERRRLLRYAAYNNFNDAGTMMLTTRADNFFIAAIIDPIAVGIYAFYTRLNLMASNLLPLKQFENVIQPVFFAVRPEEADQKVPQYFSMLVNLNLLLQWPMLAYASAYHAEIVEVVFDGKFVEHSWLLPLLGGFSVFHVFTTPVTLVAQYEEKAGIILLSKLFAIYNVIALLFLLPNFGVYGAAIAGGSAHLMKNGFIWWHVRQKARWLNATRALLASLALWGLVVTACRLLGQLLAELPIVSLGVGVIVIGIGGVLHVRGPAISADDRRILANVFHGAEGKWLRRIGLLRAAESRSQGKAEQ